jgi:hypothetical protein
MNLSSLLLSAVATSAAASQSEFCPTLFADFTRRQLTTFNSTTPYTLADGPDGDAKAKHVPFLSVSEDGLTGSVVVGNGDDGGVWHPMVASDDPAVVHFVTHIMVQDQVRHLLAFGCTVALVPVDAMNIYSTATVPFLSS